MMIAVGEAGAASGRRTAEASWRCQGHRSGRAVAGGTGRGRRQRSTVVHDETVGASGGFVPWDFVVGVGAVALVRDPRMVMAGGRNVSGAQGGGSPEAGARSCQKQAHAVVVAFSELRHARALVAQVTLHVEHGNGRLARCAVWRRGGFPGDKVVLSRRRPVW